HPNERLVQFAYRGRRRNHKHCQPVGRPPHHLRAGTRPERLPGLADLGADQCGVPGCDWRSNTNPKCNSHSYVYSNACGDTYSNSNRYAHTYPRVNINANLYSNSDACTYSFSRPST